MSFTDQLKKARKSTGMTQEQAAKALSIDKSTYCGYETGKRKPDVERIKELAQLFNVKADILLETNAQPKLFVTKEEFALIEKYRSLDDSGKSFVEAVTEREYQRVTPSYTPSSVSTLAAHGEGATLSEQEEALSKLLAAHPELGD